MVIWFWCRRSRQNLIKYQKKELTKKNGYNLIWNPSKKKKGYSGVAVFYKKEPVRYSLEFPEEKFSGEGRVIELEYEDFYVFNIYFPNGQMSDERLKFKLDFYDYFLSYAEEKRKKQTNNCRGRF